MWSSFCGSYRQNGLRRIAGLGNSHDEHPPLNAYHFVTLAGVAFLIFAILLGIQTLLYKLMGYAVSGFSTVILLLLIIGSMVMIALGIIGEYISRIYDEVKERPRYIVSERIDS